MNVLQVKKIISAIICIIICIFSFLQTAIFNMDIMAFDGNEEEILFNGNIYYQINDRHEIIITRSRASVTEAVIPSEINGMPVTEIRGSAFNGKTRLTKVVIPCTVTKIGDYAFYQCTRLNEIDIPSSVTEIGWNILKDTPWLQNQPEGCILVGNNILIAYQGEPQQVVIPEGVTAIAGCAFENLKSMMSVIIPESVKIIGGLAFSGCTKLTECTVPEGVRKIEAYAFNWCEALQRVTIADSVETIGNHAFLGCSALISVKLPKNLSRIETAVFCGCTSLTKITIPEHITDIGSQAFMHCISLSEVKLHKGIVSIGPDAFEGCTGLSRLMVYNENCYIAGSEKTISPNTTIYGFRESTAQFYAQSYERQFIIVSLLEGDMNDDGTVNVADATILLSIYAKYAAHCINHIDAFDIAAGDINRNGTLDIGDATNILKLYADKGAGFELDK